MIVVTVVGMNAGLKVGCRNWIGRVWGSTTVNWVFGGEFDMRFKLK